MHISYQIIAGVHKFVVCQLQKGKRKSYFTIFFWNLNVDIKLFMKTTKSNEAHALKAYLLSNLNHVCKLCIHVPWSVENIFTA